MLSTSTLYAGPELDGEMRWSGAQLRANSSVQADMKLTRGLTMLLATALLGGAGASACAAATVDVLPVQWLDALMPGTDGSLWAVQHPPAIAAPTPYTVLRLNADGGIASAADVPDGLTPLDTNGVLHPLPDGSMGMFAQRLQWTGSSPSTAGLALVRFSPEGAVMNVTQLPRAAWQTGGLAVAPDGAIWFARSCADRLDRIGLDGRVTEVRLPRVGCGTHAPGRELGAGLAFDVTGALWLVNLCMGRIDRVTLDGRVREWRALRISCPYQDFDLPTATPATIELDPRGGIAYTSRVMGTGSGRVRDGRRQRFPSDGVGVFSLDGAPWRLVRHGIERRDPDGSIATFRRPTGLGDVSDLAVLRDGRVAVVRGSYWKSYNANVRDSVDEPLYLRPVVAAFDATGEETDWGLPDGGSDAPTQLDHATTLLGPDGALWSSEQRIGLSPSVAFAWRLVRVLPDDVGPPRAALASVKAVLGRVRRTLWLQLACHADLARFCTGAVALAGARMSARALFTIAGGMRGAVPVPLGSRMLRLLRQRRSPSVIAVVRTDAGTTTCRLRIPA